jgi:hypothetical protein
MWQIADFLEDLNKQDDVRGKTRFLSDCRLLVTPLSGYGDSGAIAIRIQQFLDRNSQQRSLGKIMNHFLLA